MLALCAEGFADADLLRAFCDRNQHNVHDSDSADQQGDSGDTNQCRRHRAGDGVHLVKHLLHTDDGVEVLAAKNLV